MSTPKAIVTVQGGVVQSVDLDGDIIVEVRDYDNGEGQLHDFCDEIETAPDDLDDDDIAALNADRVFLDDNDEAYERTIYDVTGSDREKTTTVDTGAFAAARSA